MLLRKCMPIEPYLQVSPPRLAGVCMLRVGCKCCKCCKCTPCSSFTRVNLPVNAVNIPVNDASFTCKCCGFAQNSCKCCKFSCKCCKFACAVKDEHGVQCKCCKQPSGYPTIAKNALLLRSTSGCNKPQIHMSAHPKSYA